jgi:hypothetical protein
VPFKLAVQTVTGTSSYQLFPGGAPFKCRVLGMRGIMTSAGGASDSVALQKNSSSVIIAAVDVSAMSDKDIWDASTLDDAFWDLNPGDLLKVVTVSDALSYVVVDLVNVEDL